MGEFLLRQVLSVEADRVSAHNGADFSFGETAGLHAGSGLRALGCLWWSLKPWQLGFGFGQCGYTCVCIHIYPQVSDSGGNVDMYTPLLVCAGVC